MKPIKLSELIEAIEFDSPEHISSIDLQEGRHVIIEESVLRAVEEGDDDLLNGLPEWQKEQIEVARAMNADSGDRFIDAPDKFEFHEYHHMEGFIRDLGDSAAAEQLWRAIKGKGAFRHFKNTAHSLGLLDQWYAYRQDAMKQFVIDWCETHKIQFADDLPRKPAR